jgi:predicted metal-binding membrane protein
MTPELGSTQTVLLIWMALLTALMVHEKTRPLGARTVPLTGVTLLALGSTLFLWAASVSP